MKKYINAMFYGDGKTKIYLWTVFLLSVVAIGLLIAGLALLSGGFAGAGVTLVIFVLLLTQSVSLSDTGYDADETPEERKIRQEKEKEAKLKKKQRDKEKKEEERKSQKKQNGDDQEELEKEEKDDIKETDYQQYTREKLKSYFHKYKVKKDHRTVMVDSSAKYKIRQCPAYAWTHRGYFHLLLLEKEPRKISLPINEVTKMIYNKNILAMPRKDYQQFHKASLVTEVFKEYLPTYREVTYHGQTSFRKNLYSFENGIRFTDTSAKEIFKLLDMKFEVDDEVTRSVRFGNEFKNVYKNRILLNDRVIDIKEYQARIKKILEEYAMSAAGSEKYAQELAAMVKYRLITEEYRLFYLEHGNDLIANRRQNAESGR